MAKAPETATDPVLERTMCSNARPLTIFTIGHSNHALDKFIDLLKTHEIKALVDVRSSPFSQYTPHFNRHELERSLNDVGIDYAYAGEYLGGRPKDPSCYKNGIVPEGKADFLELVDYSALAQQPSYRRGLARLREIARESRIVVMCSEEDPQRCHRHHLIAQSLLACGDLVLHIRGASNESIEAAQREAQQLSLL
jgi:uncharacterized protein (DUF488 family)